MPVNSFEFYPMSWTPIKEKLKRPIYLSLAHQMERDIANGTLMEGTKLPPQRELADYLDINFTTVTRTYSLCEEKGLIYGIKGSGTFVAMNATKNLTISLENASPTCVEMGFVASFESCNNLVAPVMKNAVNKKYAMDLLSYEHPTGMAHHKSAGIHWMKKFGIDARSDQIAIVSGAQNALAITLFALFETGHKIAVDRFTYSNFIELAKLHRIQLVPIDNDSEGMIVEELDRQCKQSKIHGIFLMPSCSNPTTIVMTQKRKTELVTIIRKYDLILIEDDIHAFLTSGIVSDYKMPFFQMIPEQTIYISGTSKSVCSGLRVAYMVFGNQFKERLMRTIFNINVKTSSVDAEIISELIHGGVADEIVERKKELAIKTNQLFNYYFPNSMRNGHPLSFFRWLRIPAEIDVKHLFSKLDNKGIRVYHSDQFLVGGKDGEDYLRISLASTNTIEELEYGLLTLQKLLNKDE